MIRRPLTEAELFAAYQGAATAPGAMTEAELLQGITEALEIAGWRWTHIRRSDGVTMGDSGLPDIIAVHPTRGLVLAWELKGARGTLSGEQVAWQHALGLASALDARVVRPADYDDAIATILGALAARP